MTKYYGDPGTTSMPWGAYGPYEQDYYDKKISFEEFCRLCKLDNYGEGLTKDELREKGYRIDD